MPLALATREAVIGLSWRRGMVLVQSDSTINLCRLTGSEIRDQLGWVGGRGRSEAPDKLGEKGDARTSGASGKPSTRAFADGWASWKHGGHVHLTRCGFAGHRRQRDDSFWA